jgi:hypothetical protein
MGGKLAMISAPNLGKVSPEFLAQGGGVTLHGVVLEDGSVLGAGWDHYVWDDKGARGGVLMEALEEMRFVPPALAGKTYCISFDAVWDADNPHVMPLAGPVRP